MRFFGLDITRAQLRESAPAPSEQPTPGAEAPAAGSGSKSTNIEGKVCYANGTQSSLSVAAFYRAVALRADTMSQIVTQYLRYNSKGRNFEQDMSPMGKHLNYLLQIKPNRRTNRTVFMRQIEIMRLLYGNAYVYVKYDTFEEVEGLYLCASAAYDVTSDRYTVTYYVGNGLSTAISVPSRQVLHFRNTFSNDGGFTGISLLKYASRTLNIAATQDQLVQDTAAKGGSKKLIIQEQAQATLGLGRMQSGQMNDIRKNLQNDWAAGYDVMYVPNVANIHDFSQSLSELTIDVLRKFSVLDVARYTGVPAIMLMDGSNSNYKTPESATNEFLSRTIQPLINEWEDELNGKMLDYADFGKYKYMLDPQPLFRLDRDAEANYNQKCMAMGIVSVNELRAKYNLPSIENGDDHYVSTNLAVAGSEKLSAAGAGGAATPPEPKQPKEEDDQ